MPELEKHSSTPLGHELSTDASANPIPVTTPEKAPRPLEFPLVGHPGASEPLDREVLLRLQERALRFLVRGAVHRMNNVLAVFSSHAQLLKIRSAKMRQEGRISSPGDREVKHLLQSVDQGDSAMTLIGSLLRLPGIREERVHPRSPEKGLRGDPREVSGVSLGTFLRSLQDVLICETKGQRFHVRTKAELQVYSSMSPSALLLIVCLLLEHLQECVPTDVAGTLDLTVREDEDGPTLLISFERDSQSLPFPAQPGDLDHDLAAYLRLLGVKLHGVPGRPAYELVLPPLA